MWYVQVLIDNTGRGYYYNFSDYLRREANMSGCCGGNNVKKHRQETKARDKGGTSLILKVKKLLNNV